MKRFCPCYEIIQIESGGAPPHSKTQAPRVCLEERPRLGVRQCSADLAPYADHFTENLEAAAHALSLPRQTRWNEQKDGDSVRDNRADRGRERYRGSDRNLFSAEAGGRKFQGALSISSGKNAVVHCQSATPNLSLFRVRSRRQRFPVRHGL